MKASDYIVEYLIEKGITDVFGYPGGMVTHLMDSFSKYQDKILAHVMYHEQGAAFAACGYAQSNERTGVAYATSGPGATNLLTGICNAFMDSIPTVFITGQVNSFEQKGDYAVRQRGFQETDIVFMVKPVTKYAVQINSAERLKRELDYAFYVANKGRKGPVLLDIAMDVMRTELNPENLVGFIPPVEEAVISNEDIARINELICNKKRPVLLLGNGVDRSGEATWKKRINEIGIPIVSSMIAVDIQSGLEHYYGFIGAYGNREANFIVAKSDFIISIGARLDVRQVGAKRENFAPEAEIFRVDIDKNELAYHVHEDEIDICADANVALEQILSILENISNDYSAWISVCEEIKEKLYRYDDAIYNELVREISRYIPEKSISVTDVGQNQVWVAQSYEVKKGQKLLFSGGHGAMGYSLPAAIGACLSQRRPTYSFNGDGGIQMNIQELQVISREKLPVKVIVFNNNALGMIRHFQEMYFKDNYFQTTPEGGFSSPNFQKLAEAYEIEYRKIHEISEIKKLSNLLVDERPALIEIQLLENTYVFPKLEFGKPNQDQEPLIDRKLYEHLMKL